MEIIELKSSLLEEASELFMNSYHCQRTVVPILDENNATTEKIISMLEWCLEKHAGVAAYENNKMAGYMIGIHVDKLLGEHKGVYCPEWTHNSTNEKAFEIYRLMYQAIGQQWVDNGHLTHAINFMNHSQNAQKAFCWNGFGSVGIDAVRPVEPVKVELSHEVYITSVQEDDISAWLPLVESHNQHLTTSPIFKPYLKHGTEEKLVDTLQNSDNNSWMAWIGDEAVGYIETTDITDGAGWIVNGERKIAVNGAFVKPEYRRNGIAKSLLSTVMDWAAKEGFMRCSVDFEAANIEACYFWLNYFQPVCRSMVRKLDKQIL